MLEEQLIARDSEICRLVDTSKQLSMSCEELDDELRKKNRLLDDYHTELNKEEDAHRMEVTDLTAKLMDAEDGRDRALQ